ncbi:hypothetical protein Sya03_15300 [Spirilliplanes yamanashiensis]|uniref:Pyrrolo-quinoline quinone repeat domain-containing protein n=1 Tax=Spirilliplanes yamanashiensis TaxID=42233 RepID=A0A8J3Y5J8_9ACTN|nr:hypothetical protein Sya03_15300 [Spirilliplanes yamanashiensis]
MILVLIAVVTLALTNVWNPWPGVWAWVVRSEPIAQGVAAWEQQLDGSHKSVTVAGAAVVVEYRTRTEAFGTQAGAPLWEKNADWSAVAGQGDSAVVVTGELLSKGYEVLDPLTGAVRRTDTEAKAVWTYADAILDVRCLEARDCELSAWDPRGTAPLWTVSTPGMGFVLFADNPALPGTKPLTGDAVDGAAGGPGRLPGVIGFPADNRLHVVDTAAGRVEQVLDLDRRDRRVTVAGGRVLTVTATAADGTCYFAVSAADARSGREVWQADGLNLRTAGDGAGCEQQHDPAGGQDVVLGVDPTGREQLIDAHDGRRLWKGTPAHRVLAVDDRRALIRTGRRLSAWDFSRGRTAWERTVHDKAQAAVTPYAVVVVDQGPRRVAALRTSTGAVLAEFRTGARVLAVGPSGMVVGEGRQMAYLPFNGISAVSS